MEPLKSQPHNRRFDDPKEDDTDRWSQNIFQSLVVVVISALLAFFFFHYRLNTLALTCSAIAAVGVAVLFWSVWKLERVMCQDAKDKETSEEDLPA